MDILSCNWDTARLFIFSGNVFGPLVYYSHLFALLSSFIIGLIIFLKDPKALINRILFFITISFSFWVFFDLALWANEKPDLQMFFWSLLVIIEPIIYAACLYFIYVFVEKKDISFYKKLGIGILLLPTLVFASTKLALIGFDLSTCDREVAEGPIVLYGYIIELIFTFQILYFVTKKALRANAAEIKQIIFVTLGIVLFLFSFAFGNIIGSFTDDWTLGQYGLFGMPVFVAFLAYIIVRFKTFNVKIIGAQFLVFALGFLTFSILFIRKIENVRVVVLFTLAFVVILGYLLIRSVRKDIKQKEYLAQLTGELEAANAKLTDLDKVKNEFLSFATHQMRSPLTSIKWGLETLLDEETSGPLSEPQKVLVHKVKDISVNMASTVNDLLDISKIEQGGLVLQKEVFSLADLVKSLADEMKPVAEGKKLQFSYIPDTPSKYIVAGDQTKLRQVITNLIDNSIKYTDAGSVEVHIGQGDVGKVRVFVKDTGRGLTKEDSEKLFGKFVRAKSGSANKSGSGLGLYLAKKIIEMHDGVLSAESPGEGKGSTFSFTLPFEG